MSRNLHPKLLEKIEKAATISDESPWNRIEGKGKWGIICNGVSYGYANDAVRELGVAERFKILRVGFSHPFPENLTHRFLDGCEKVMVAEEGEPYMQEAVRNCAHRFGMMLPVHGKGDGLFSRLYEFDPMMAKKVIASYFNLPFKRFFFGQYGGHGRHTFTVAMGQARYPDIESAMALLEGRVKRMIAFDAFSLAGRAGSSLSLNMVLLGALAQSGTTSVPPDRFRDVIKDKTKEAFAEVNLKAFELGMRAAEQET